jgi:predicted Kef-type K+ transport protein
MQHGELGFLTFGLVLLAAAVLSVPIARRLGLSAIVAYLIAGIVIGPHGMAAFGTPESIIPVSELGVVMLLFLIGLELELGRLVALRRAIFGLGAAQLALTALAIGALAYLVGLVDWRGAVVAGVALAMSATAIALEILEERGQLQQDYGQRAFAILLFQDMAVVPLLAVLPLLAQAGESNHADVGDGLRAVALIVGAILLIVVAGRYLLNPFFRLLAQTGSREVMTAAALLVVPRRGAGHAKGRHVDGPWRLPGRRPACRIQLSARARSRHRTVPRPLAGPVLHGHRNEHRSGGRARQSLADSDCGRGHHRAQGGDRLAAVQRHLRAPGRCAAAPDRC